MRRSFALLLALTLAGPLAAQDRHLALEDVVPDDTLVFMTFAGCDAASEAATRLSAYSLWKEEEVQAFFAPLREAWHEAAREGSTPAGREFAAARPVLGGRLSVALRGTTLVWERGGPPMPVPSGLVALDLGEGGSGRREAVEKALGRTFGRVRETRQDVHGFTVHRHDWRIDGMKVALERAWVGDLLLVGVNRFFLEDCLAGIASEGGGRGALSSLPAFRKCRKKSAPEPLLEVFVNLPVLTGPMEPFLPDEARHVLRRLDLDRVDGLYMSSAIKDGDGSDTWFVSKPAPHDGVFALGCETPLSAGARHFAPAESIVYFAGKTDLARAYDLFLGAALDVLPATYAGAASQGIDSLSSFIGLDVREDVLGVLGDEIAFYLAFDQSRLAPDVGLAVGLRDPEGARELVLSLLERSGARVTERELAGRTTWLVTPPRGTRGTSVMVPASPSLAFTESHMLLAATTSGLAGALERLGQGGGGLPGSAHFREAFTGYDVERASLVSYVDLRRAGETGYGWLYDFAPGLIAQSGLPLDPARFPRPEVITPHLSSAASLGMIEEGGWVIRSRSFGLAPMLALLVRVADETEGDIGAAIGGLEGLFRSAGPAAGGPAPRGRSGERRLAPTAPERR